MGVLQQSNHLGLTIGAIVTISVLLILAQLLRSNHHNPETAVEDDPHRGVTVTVVTGAVVAYLSFFYIDGIGSVDTSTSVLLISIMTMNTISFVIDEVFSTNDGYNLYKKDGLTPAARRAIGRVKTPAFLRHFIVTLLDMFIINVLSGKICDVLSRNVSPNLSFTLLRQKVNVNNLMQRATVNALMLMLFLIYGNRLRMQWAHGFDQNVSFLVVIAVICTSMVFLTDTHTANANGVNHPIVKVLIVAVALAVLVYGTINNSIYADSVSESNQDNLWIAILIITSIVVLASMVVAQSSNRPVVMSLTSILFCSSILIPIIASLYNETLSRTLAIIALAAAPIVYLISKDKLKANQNQKLISPHRSSA